jgi:hypothetical protein
MFTTTPVCDEMRRGGLRQEKRRAQVEIDRLVPLLRLYVAETASAP